MAGYCQGHGQEADDHSDRSIHSLRIASTGKHPAPTSMVRPTTLKALIQAPNRNVGAHEDRTDSVTGPDLTLAGLAAAQASAIPEGVARTFGVTTPSSVAVPAPIDDPPARVRAGHSQACHRIEPTRTGDPARRQKDAIC